MCPPRKKVSRATTAKLVPPAKSVTLSNLFRMATAAKQACERAAGGVSCGQFPPGPRRVRRLCRFCLWRHGHGPHLVDQAHPAGDAEDAPPELHHGVPPGPSSNFCRLH